MVHLCADLYSCFPPQDLQADNLCHALSVSFVCDQFKVSIYGLKPYPTFLCFLCKILQICLVGKRENEFSFPLFGWD